MRQLVVVLVAGAVLFAERRPGSPLDHLPKNMEMLTHFGERADYSPDNQRIAFMAKSFGDAFAVDLKTRTIRCLTCSVPGAAFLRVMHLSDGNFMLIGPERFSDIRTSRSRDNELWFLSKEAGSKPVKLGQKMSEGAAISKKNLRIAWSETNAQFPELARDYSRLVVADFEYSGNVPKIVRQRTVYESKDAKCRIEAQDFYELQRLRRVESIQPRGVHRRPQHRVSDCPHSRRGGCGIRNRHYEDTTLNGDNLPGDNGVDVEHGDESGSHSFVWMRLLRYE